MWGYISSKPFCTKAKLETLETYMKGPSWPLPRRRRVSVSMTSWAVGLWPGSWWRPFRIRSYSQSSQPSGQGRGVFSRTTCTTWRQVSIRSNIVKLMTHRQLRFASSLRNSFFFFCFNSSYSTMSLRLVSYSAVRQLPDNRFLIHLFEKSSYAVFSTQPSDNILTPPFRLISSTESFHFFFLIQPRNNVLPLSVLFSHPTTFLR